MSEKFLCVVNKDDKDDKRKAWKIIRFLQELTRKKVQLEELWGRMVK